MAKKRAPQAIGLTAQDIRNVMKTEFDHYLSDIEFRVKQAYEVSGRPIDARAMGWSDKEIDQYSQHAPVTVQGSVYAEDMNTLQHMITGYTVTSNSPAAGQIAWTSLHVVYGGTDYTVTDGNAAVADYYLWFQKSTATGTAPNMNVVMSKNPVGTKPPLATGDAIIFLNNAGVPVSLLEQNLPRVLADNAVDTGAIALGAVTGPKVGTGANGLDGTNLKPGANIVGTQLTNGTLGQLQLGQGAVVPSKLSILEHVLY